MYSMFTHIYHTIQPNVGKYIMHGWYGYGKVNAVGYVLKPYTTKSLLKN